MNIIDEMKEDLHYMNVLKSNASIMQEQIRHAIDTAIVLFEQSIILVEANEDKVLELRLWKI